MTRRIKKSDLRLAKKYSRHENTLDQKLLMIIACEGEKTERYYFDSFFKILKEEKKLSKKSLVFATHQHTNPLGVLQDLKGFRDQGISYEDYQYRWIVIDRDEERSGGGGHTLDDFNQAIHQSENNQPKINVAWSNPSFEIWYLLHFNYNDTPIDRDLVITHLSKAMKYSYQKESKTMYNELHDRLMKAISNTKKLMKFH
jgi:hypothetical protein